MEHAIGWTLFSVSPDYYNACADTFIVDVPGNAFGYQHASAGQAYIGCYTYRTGPLVREHVQAQLDLPLVPGLMTYLSMKVAAGGFGFAPDGNYNVRFATRGIGMRFSTQPPGPGPNISNTAALFMATVLQDTADWVTLSGTYLPDSAYAYVQIGNFFADSLSDPTMIDPDGMIDGAYAFIDEVCVATVPGTCAGPNSVEHLSSGSMLLSGGVIGEELWLNLGNGAPVNARLLLVDAMGQTCWTGAWQANVQSYRLSMASFANGAYCLTAVTSSGARQALRFIFLSP